MSEGVVSGLVHLGCCLVLHVVVNLITCAGHNYCVLDYYVSFMMNTMILLNIGNKMPPIDRVDNGKYDER